MRDCTRFAVYWAPEAGSALARFGAAWLGRDAGTGEAVPQPEVPGATPLGEITTAPRHYGFHGTLKPPFRLADGCGEAGLDRAVAELAAGIAAFEAPRLAPVAADAFLSLRPAGPAPALDRLAAACVRGLDRFRAPPGEPEIARRRRAGLSDRQSELLARWGYPYVLEEFAFHLTLTDAIGNVPAARIAEEYAALLAPVCADPLPIREICLFAERQGKPFLLVKRYPLSG